MTLIEIRDAICNHCNLSSPDALARVVSRVNQRYRRITASLGLDTSRFVTKSVSASVGVRTVTFTGIEKIDRVLDATTSSTVLLQEVSMHEMRTTQVGTSAPMRYAVQSAAADSVVILLDTLPQTAYDLQADGWVTLADLEDDDEPAFPESYHDILVFDGISEELLKKEKDKIALVYATKARDLLADLRFFLADSHTRETQQASGRLSASSGAAGGSGSGSGGGTAYTQTALLTFDRGASTAPFAVEPSTALYVANLGAEFIGNVASDRLIGRDTLGTGESEQITVGGGIEFTGAGAIQRSSLTGDVTATAGSSVTTIGPQAVTVNKLGSNAVTDVKVDAAAAIQWSKISKSGSSIADLATKSAADLTSGTVNEARLGSGTGTVNKVLRGNSTWGDSPGIATNGNSAITAVTFSSSGGASSGANDLDEYEETTSPSGWTLADNSGAALTFTSVATHSVKIGQMVWAFFAFTFPATASGASASISGLPYTPLTSTARGGALFSFTTYSATGVTLAVNSGSATASFTNTAGAALTNADLSGRSFAGVLVYRAAV